jgi:branched-chain amino acid transport system permease protein
MQTRFHLPYLGATVGAAIAGVGLGLLLEYAAIRRALKTGSTATWILATVALGIILRNAVERIWGTDDLPFPAPFGNDPLILGGVRVLPQEILVIVVASLIMLALELFRRRSAYGKAITAVAADKDAAALMGINVGRVMTLSFIISSVLAAVAGVLIAPLTLVSPTMGTLLGTKAYAVAIIGGLQSGLGGVVGGLLLGLSEQFTARYISTGFKDTPGFVLLILILLVKPAGLFGKRTVRKV